MVSLPTVSIADPGYLSRIQIFCIPDPHQRILEFKYLNQKNGFKALGNMILVVHTRSRSRNLIFLRIPDPEVKKATDPGTLVQDVKGVIQVGCLNDDDECL